MRIIRSALYPAFAFVGWSTAAAQTAPPTAESRIDTIVVRQMRARRIPGLSLGVVRDGHLVYSKGYGDANLEWRTPASPETVFLLASVTKTFTAAAIMTLVTDGRIGLEDLIGKYVSAPDAWKDITIRQLLTHTSGLKDRFELTDDGRMYLSYTTAQMLDAAAHTAVDFAPGTRWQYSDQGFFLLGAVIERASGKKYADFVRERIFQPAGMTASTFHDWSAIVPNRADGYALAGDQLVGSRRRYQFEIGSHYGAQSTVTDLARYDSALTAGAILPKPARDQMWTPAKLSDGRIADFAGVGYGFGWFLERFNGHRLVYHAGSTGTCLFKLPDDGITVIVLTNLEQISGSDPCFIARGVATRYVPAVSIAEVPVMAETDTSRARHLRTVIEALTDGRVDAADYAPDALAAIRATAAAQSAALRQLGPLQSFALIADDAMPTRVVYYRAKYTSATINFRFVLDDRGRVASLQGR